MHLAFISIALVPMVGPSASISAFMAAAMRFAFQRSGPLGSGGTTRKPTASRAGAQRGCCARARLTFLAVWFARNLVSDRIAIDRWRRAVDRLAGHIGGFSPACWHSRRVDPVKGGAARGGPDQATTIPSP